MKTLITLFTGIMLIGCAGADHQSTIVALASSAVFHAENEAKPLPIGTKAVTGIRYPSLKSPACSCVSITLPASS